MVKLFETIGLTYSEMADVTAYILLVITFGVFAGKCFYDGVYAILDIIRSVLGFLYRLVKKHLRKHFPNVRKRKKGKCHDKR